MQELKPNQKLIEIADYINQEVWKSAQTLNKGPIKLDHNDVRSSVQTALLLEVLTEIRDELRFSNHEKRMSSLPLSMFNQQRSSDHNKGE
jgi:hypothetical protein